MNRAYIDVQFTQTEQRLNISVRTDEQTEQRCSGDTDKQAVQRCSVHAGERSQITFSSRNELSWLYGDIIFLTILYSRVLNYCLLFSQLNFNFLSNMVFMRVSLYLTNLCYM